MWQLSFITEEQLTEHVRTTITKYGDKLEAYDLAKFNSNIIDPIKLLFDKTVYHLSWEEIVKNEIFRQRDKSNNNDIGYFHQNIFAYFRGCIVPETGWDIIYKNKSGVDIEGEKVQTLYIEMKNKHNTMNSASAAKTYIKMQDQLLSDDNCACFLVEIIAKKSQNVLWKTSVDQRKVQHKRIRKTSIDQFYSLVTGIDDAYYQLCLSLPEIIEKVVNDSKALSTPYDKAFEELKKLSTQLPLTDKNKAMILAVYLLGFSDYMGFKN